MTMNARYFTIKPILPDTGETAAQMPGIQFARRSWTLIVPASIFLKVHNEAEPSEQGAAYLALHRAIHSWQGYPKTTTSLKIREAGNATVQSSQEVVPQTLIESHLVHLKRQSTQFQWALKPFLNSIYCDLAFAVSCVRYLINTVRNRLICVTGKKANFFYR